MVLRRALLLAIALAPGAAAAAGKPKADEESVAGLTVDIPAITAPVARDGRLTNYIFLSLRLHASNSAGAQRVRDRPDIFRDALIRALHRNPVPASAAPGQLADITSLPPRLVQIAQGVMPAGQVRVTRMEIVRADPLMR
jgi:hypothetical protein